MGIEIIGDRKKGIQEAGPWHKWMAEINMWRPDSKDGSKERNSRLGINTAADKKWKYWMGGVGGSLLPILQRQWGRSTSHLKQFKN